MLGVGSVDLVLEIYVLILVLNDDYYWIYLSYQNSVIKRMKKHFVFFLFYVFLFSADLLGMKGKHDFIQHEFQCQKQSLMFLLLLYLLTK